MITEKDIIDATILFRKQEERADFFDLASNLMKAGYEIEAYILILATWNFAKFRYAAKIFDIANFKDKVNSISIFFNKLNGENIKSIILEYYKTDIIAIYTALSNIKGVEFTGASKLMHLKNPELFIMWDGYIRGEKPKKYYKELDLFKKGDYEFKQYGTTGNDYYDFLVDMKEKYGNIGFHQHKQSFAKAIDEFNYMNITVKIQEIEKLVKNKKVE